MILEFVVYGVPQPKGSARAFVLKGNGDAKPRAIVTSANPKNKGWQQLVAESASAAISTMPDFTVFAGPVRLRVSFYLPRPKAIKNKVVPHTKKPDLDKLIRSVKDALKHVAWNDDSQVNEIDATKAYAAVGEPTFAHVSVRD